MIESKEDQKFSLKVAGENLVFITGTILAIPEEEVDYFIIDGDNSKFEAKSYNFFTTFENILGLNITVGSTFTYDVYERRFTFEVEAISSKDSGWEELKCILKSINLLS